MSAQSVVRGLVIAPKLQCIREPTQLRKHNIAPDVGVFLGGSVGKESACNTGDCLQCRRPGFHPWVEKILWRGKWQPTLAFLPGKFHGQKNLAGYSLQGCKESDTT